LPNVKTAPNQKLVRINKADCSQKDIYAKINKQAMLNAMRDFNGKKASGFILWSYLASNQNGYELALGNVALKNAIGMSKPAYDYAVGLLIEYKYLVKENGNIYNFYEIPKR
jgi:hypothetical protein